MSSKEFNAKTIWKVGLMIAILCIIMLLTSYVPILDVVGIILLPIPITLLYIRYNSKAAWIAVIASMLIVSLIVGPIMALSAGIKYGLIGITLGYCVKNNKSISITLIYLSAATIISTIVDFSIFLMFVSKSNLSDFVNNILVMVKNQMNDIKNIYAGMGLSEQRLAAFDKMEEILTIENLLLIMPAAWMLTLLISVSINYNVTRVILNRLRIKDMKPLSFSRFYITNLIGAFLIGLICIGIILDTRGIAIGKYLLYSSYGITSIIFALNGMAAVTYYLRIKKKLSKQVVFLILFFSLIFQAHIVYFYIGFIEIIFDFRKLDPYRIFNRKKSGV